MSELKTVSELTADTSFYESKTFIDLELEGEELQGLEFEYCIFKDCNFKEVHLNRCKFLDCQFVHCDMSLSNLGYSRFTEVNFEDCKLLALDWGKVSWPSFVPGAVIAFSRCNLSNSSFYGLALAEIEMSECRAHDVDFRGTDLNGSNFSDTDFSSSLFHNTDLAMANFCGAENYLIDIQNNSVKGATFSRLEATSLLESLGIVLVD